MLHEFKAVLAFSGTSAGTQPAPIKGKMAILSTTALINMRRIILLGQRCQRRIDLCRAVPIDRPI